MEEILEKAIKNYNKVNKAKAELLEMNENKFRVQFRGDLDLTSTMEKHFLDLVYELAEEGVEADLLDFRPGKGGDFVAKYRVKGED